MAKRPLKKIDKEDVKELIKAIKQFNVETKDKDILKDSSKITTKELMFYYLAQHAALETRVTKIETTQKLMGWFIGISISAIGVVIALLKV